MRISRVNMCSPNFGQVRRSAARRAIEEANGDIEKLRKFKYLIDEQKYNDRYDVVASKSAFYRYAIVRVDGNYGAEILCSEFENACNTADVFYKYNDRQECPIAKNPEYDNDKYTPEYIKLRDEIINSCED